MQCTSPKVTCASTDNDGDGYLSKEEIFCSFVSLWDGPELLGLDPTTDVAQECSPFSSRFLPQRFLRSRCHEVFHERTPAATTHAYMHARGLQTAHRALAVLAILIADSIP